jgi:hypothetical protein
MVADGGTLLVTLVQQAICIVGIVLNFAIIWITLKNKCVKIIIKIIKNGISSFCQIYRNLQNTYGCLLAIYSFSEAAFESSSFLPTFQCIF